MAKHILAALVENRPGVLARVANLFRRRSFNIDSLSVGRTQRDDMSRMTIVMEADSAEADRLVKNLYKLVDVVHVDHLHSQPSVAREMALVKVKADSANRREVIQLCDIFRARIIDVAAESLVVEITGEEEKLENFTELVRPFGIVEMVRTGVIALGRGSHTLKDEGFKPNRSRAAARRNVL
jgi:acetolactate synthase-1/3 small subunit